MGVYFSFYLNWANQLFLSSSSALLADQERLPPIVYSSTALYLLVIDLPEAESEGDMIPEPERGWQGELTWVKNRLVISLISLKWVHT